MHYIYIQMQTHSMALRGATAPDWMSNGIKAWEKEKK